MYYVCICVYITMSVSITDLGKLHRVVIRHVLVFVHGVMGFIILIPFEPILDIYT